MTSPPSSAARSMIEVMNHRPGRGAGGWRLDAVHAEESGSDSITRYELWKAIWSSPGDRNFFEPDGLRLPYPPSRGIIEAGCREEGAE